MEIHFATTRWSLRYLKGLAVLDDIDSARTIYSRSEVLDFLSGCDVLFVPMSFESRYHKDLLTIFPTKVTDYWLAQRPIIVYGPEEYAFLAKARNDGYAVTVAKRGSESLGLAIEEVCDSVELQESLVEASRRMVIEHDGLRIARKLMIDLGIASRQPDA